MTDGSRRARPSFSMMVCSRLLKKAEKGRVKVSAPSSAGRLRRSSGFGSSPGGACPQLWRLPFSLFPSAEQSSHSRPIGPWNSCEILPSNSPRRRPITSPSSRSRRDLGGPPLRRTRRSALLSLKTIGERDPQCVERPDPHRRHPNRHRDECPGSELQAAYCRVRAFALCRRSQPGRSSSFSRPRILVIFASKARRFPRREIPPRLPPASLSARVMVGESPQAPPSCAVMRRYRNLTASPRTRTDQARRATSGGRLRAVL